MTYTNGAPGVTRPGTTAATVHPAASPQPSPKTTARPIRRPASPAAAEAAPNITAALGRASLPHVRLPPLLG